MTLSQGIISLVEYKLITESHIEKLLEDINLNAAEGWRVNTTIQEHGYIKILLERDTQ
jgi:hypothetical protein